MASWSELLEAFNIEASKTPDPHCRLDNKLKEYLDAISKHRGDATVIFYASAFLQKANDDVSITREDINGFMNALSGKRTDKGLVLILHTPGGDPNAVESIVEYLHAKFDRIDVNRAILGNVRRCDDKPCKRSIDPRQAEPAWAN